MPDWSISCLDCMYAFKAGHLWWYSEKNPNKLTLQCKDLGNLSFVVLLLEIVLIRYLKVTQTHKIYTSNTLHRGLATSALHPILMSD